jgi:asparagine synthase (glutamine-hydrolysing)
LKQQPFDRKAARLSGIAGIFHRNGAPIDRELLLSLADFLFYRGPDSRAIWMDGSIGLVHTLLRTTRESLGEHQPASLEGRYWIVADARLDSRDELIAELQRSRRKVPPSTPDGELLMHAYATWGSPCVDRLRGDFSFAIWDAGHKHLFCARDHFGIKPFYYAQLGELFLFSNTLNCVRLHPGVTGELNDAAIGDFLLFGLNYDQATTSFRDIQRLPPAHCLTFSAEGLRIKRYWTPPTDGRIRYSKSEEYVENFQLLLQAAVADRLRLERVGLLLSGGLDSSSVAAVAKEITGKGDAATDIRGYTYVYKSLIPDQEGDYAREVGEFLRVPLKFMAADHTELFEGWGDPEFSLPEPVEDPLFADFLDSCRNISADCRVLLSGEGNDNLMDFQMWPYAGDLLRKKEWRRFLTETANYFWIRPFPWRGIRTRMRRLAGKDPDMPIYPRWLSRAFQEKANLEERWKQLSEHPMEPSTHPIVPNAHASLSLPHWTQMFEQENAGLTPYPLEMRYPFLDLRIVNYLLAIPPFPWFFEKMLLREAMAGRIPERIRVRPKTPLQGDLVSAQLKRTGLGSLSRMQWSKDSDRFIERSALAAPHDKMKAEEIRVNLRPYCLNIWLQSARGVRYNLHAEAGNG